MLLFHDVLPVDQPVRPLAVDYRHGDSEPDHYHNCAQLIHSLSGVVQVTTRLGSCGATQPRRLGTGENGAQPAHHRPWQP